MINWGLTALRLYRRELLDDVKEWCNMDIFSRFSAAHDRELITVGSN